MIVHSIELVSTPVDAAIELHGRLDTAWPADAAPELAGA